MHGKINARVQIFPPETVLQEKSKQTHARSGPNRFYKIWHKRQRISSSGSLQTDLWKIEGLRIKLSVGWCETTWLFCPAGKETSSRVHLKKMNLFKWCKAVFSWKCQGDTEHKHSWIVACIDILKWTRGVRKIVPGVKFITSEMEKSEQKINWRDDPVQQGEGLQQDLSNMQNKNECYIKLN